MKGSSNYIEYVVYLKLTAHNTSVSLHNTNGFRKWKSLLVPQTILSGSKVNLSYHLSETFQDSLWEAEESPKAFSFPPKEDENKLKLDRLSPTLNMVREIFLELV